MSGRKGGKSKGARTLITRGPEVDTETKIDTQTKINAATEINTETKIKKAGTKIKDATVVAGTAVGAGGAKTVARPSSDTRAGPVNAGAQQRTTGEPARAPKPAGQRLYEMPYSAVAPRLVNPDLGLRNLVARAGHNAAYEIDVTLLDAPDHRLIRSGVLLAHRVLDGRGEWYLTAPDWQPLLPKDRIEQMGHADLPEELADLIRPLRRRAPLGPVAALRCERREFALRDEAGVTVALLRDDKVTLRRGGLTTARYREVMLTPVGPGLSEDQVAWLDRALLAAGSTLVPRFPRLVSRLGAPATGPSDVPPVADFQAETPFKRFVAQLLGLRLRRLLEADLAVRGGDLDAAAPLVEQVRLLLAELQGLALVTRAGWVPELADDLEWLLGDGPGEALVDRVPVRLRGERYLTLLDRLIAAARAPRLGRTSAQGAGEVAAALLAEVTERIEAAVRAVDDDAPVGDAPDGAVVASGATGGGATRSGDRDAERWRAVYRAVADVDAATALAAHVAPKAATELTARLTKPRRLLTRARTHQLGADEALGRVAGLSPEQAFAAGREYERQAVETRRARAEFRRAWRRAHTKLVRHGVAPAAP